MTELAILLSKIINKTGDVMHPCLIHSIYGKAFNILLISKLFAKILFVGIFNKSIIYFLSVIIVDECVFYQKLCNTSMCKTDELLM